MKIFRYFIGALLVASLVTTSKIRAEIAEDTVRSVAPIMLKTNDGLTIYGRYYQTAKPKALILLFHQAKSGKDEYSSIAPGLVASGYSALAIDQRSGGNLFGTNQTAAAIDHPVDFLSAREDLEAALSWGVQKNIPVILWGSSYSASLVFLVAAVHPHQVQAVLAFSPGEYFDQQPTVVRNAASHVTSPIYVTSANDPEEIAAARSILAASPAKLKAQYIPRSGGLHGSSTLIASRNPNGAEDNWHAVLNFIDQVSLSHQIPSSKPVP